MALDPGVAFSSLPETLSKDLLSAFAQVETNFSERRWEPSELNGGKLCEAAYTVVLGFLDGQRYPARAEKPQNMVQACLRLESKYPQGVRAARIQIPRMLMALYEIRNNRGVGHAGSDVDPNQMDATAVLYMSKWVVAELVRLLHAITPDEASQLVEGLVEREISIVWARGDRRRVLNPALTQRQQVLVLLASVDHASEVEIVRWLEHNRPSNLRTAVLRPLHAQRLIDYDESARVLRLLPPGVEQAEALIRMTRA